jgi:DNA-binding response OmpR family regulator
VTATDAAELHLTGSPGPQLLLVEDEESIGSLVSAYLEQTGYRVAWVRSGEEALSTFDQLEPRMVILDIGLPGADGFDICRAIRARSTVPILMLTARDEEADRVAGLEVGADDYVSKPFSPRELAARVKAVLRRSEPSAPTHNGSRSATSCSIRRHAR